MRVRNTTAPSYCGREQNRRGAELDILPGSGAAKTAIAIK